MISSFIREQKTYSKNDLCLLLSCSYTEWSTKTDTKGKTTRY